MGINQFLLRAEMYERVQGLEERRRGRRAVIRAVILLMQQDGLDEEGAYSRLRRESMRARQNMELYCEEFLNKRAKPPDATSRTTGITPQGGDKQAI
jgi:AmiR/NasT family two-component response regulator